MATAIFSHGKPGMIDHTPSGAVTAGTVIVANGATYIAHEPLAANALGAVADGGGVYEATCASAVEADQGDIAYWNASTGITRTSTDTVFGRFVKDKAALEVVALVRHINTIDT